MDEKAQQNTPDRSKRSFLKRSLLFIGGAVALAASWGMGRFALFSNEKKKLREVSPEVLAKLQPDVPVHVPGAEAWIVKRMSDGSVVAFDDRCTHLGCRPNWNPQRNLFECPCHGSEFDMEGVVKRGPAKLPMARLSLSTKEGEKARLLDRPPTS
jgi:nitrite reductase/ring-hydroxylating ferredoxin subunit